MRSGFGSKQWGLRWVAMVFICFLGIASLFVLADESLEQAPSRYYHGTTEEFDLNYFQRVVNISSHQKVRLVYQHVWPEMKFGWKIVVGSIIGFLGAACGSVGGVGGGGIFVPMLTLIIGFDPKSSTALSKCMITGAAAATVYYNLKQRHPTLDMPLIDYDLALLFQPMLVLGISIGVSLNVIFADWMITTLLIILLMGTSTKAFVKGVESWKKETLTKKEAAISLESNGSDGKEVDYESAEPGGPNNNTIKETKKLKDPKVSLLENVYWKELGLVVAVWFMILALQIAKNYTTTCSAAYWVLNVLQIPVAVGVSSYEAVRLYKGRRVIASRGEAGKDWRVSQLVFYCVLGVVAGMLGGMLGLGGGFILGPLFLEMGIPPQVSSATVTFAMAFSSSMSVVEYYLLKRFPIPYALFFVAVTAIAALVGQHVVGKLIKVLGRASLIIFILAFTIFTSALLLGGVGIENMVEKIKQNEYLGFDDLCSYKA